MAMKKFLLGMLLMAASTCAFAQFEKDTKYVGASLSGLSLSYSHERDFSLCLGGHAGYFIEDNLMILGDLGVETQNLHFNKFKLGVKGRYYFQENGVYCAAGLKFVHKRHAYDDLQFTPEVGYCYFVNQSLSVEPAAFWDMSFSDFCHRSELGVKIGIGIYFK